MESQILENNRNTWGGGNNKHPPETSAIGQGKWMEQGLYMFQTIAILL